MKLYFIEKLPKLESLREENLSLHAKEAMFFARSVKSWCARRKWKNWFERHVRSNVQTFYAHHVIKHVGSKNSWQTAI